MRGHRRAVRDREAGEAPLHVAIGGGLIGAIYVGSIVWTVRALGAGGLTAAVIAGQLALAVVLALGTWFVVKDLTSDSRRYIVTYRR